MAGLTDTEINAVVDAETPRLVYMSLHTADPGSTGTNEATGGSYARQAVTFGAAATKVATGGQVTFSVAAGTYTHGGYWTAATGGTFRGGRALGASQTLAAAGEVKVTPTLTGSSS